MQALFSQLVAGLSLGSILLLAALGLALTFGQMGVINMAHGEFMMAGAYTAFVAQGLIADAGTSLLLAIPLGFLVGGVMGVVLEATLIRRMYHRPLDTLLVTWGVSLILQQAARDIFGAPNVDVRAPTWLSGSVNIGVTQVPAARLFILVLALTAVVGLSTLLKMTPLGRRIRGVVQNRDLAETVGISTRSTDRLTFFIGSGLAGIAGVALTLLGSTGPTLGTSYIVDAFLVVVAGGIGQIKGAVIAAFGLGLLQATFEYSTTASIDLRFLIGPNGAGKTTLVDAITGLAPATGSVRFGRTELIGKKVHRIARLGVGRTFQTASVFEELTVLQNLDIAAGTGRSALSLLRRRSSVPPVVEQAMDIVGLTAQRDRPAGALAHGQKQWLEIGMLLVQNARVLLLDEPVAGMSADERVQTGELLRRIGAERTVVVVEHDMDFMRSFATSVTVLHAGKVLSAGTVAQVQADPKVQEVYLGRAEVAQ
jgi:urea transport system permease protein